MNSIQKLKNILNSITLDEQLKEEANQAFEDLETKWEEVNFYNLRLLRDQRVNENFVKKTVNLLENTNESLKKANDKLLKTNLDLLKTNEELERFAFIASHDLKTPLLNIMNFSQLLGRKLPENTSQEIRTYLSFILEGGERMKNLIVDVLEYSRITNRATEEEIKPICLDSLIEEISRSISAYINQKNATILLPTPLPKLSWNYAKIFILFKNLIENGIKYNKSETPIVKIYSQKEKGITKLYIEDNGIGIEEKYHDKIFKLFSRLHNHAEYEGTGLGLATCKKIVEEFGGTISLKSQVNINTIFTITLPNAITSNHEEIHLAE